MNEYNTDRTPFYTTGSGQTTQPRRTGGPLTLNQYLTRVFGWMVAGLGATFATAVVFQAALSNRAFFNIISSIPAFHMLLLVAEMLVVIKLDRNLTRMDTQKATAMFFLYAVLNGLTFASILYVYSLSDVVFAFLAALLYFGLMAAYGATTKRDLTGWGRVTGPALVTLLIVNLLGIFFDFGPLDLLICSAAIVLFLCITARDIQRPTRYHSMWSGNTAMAEKGAIFGALQLYLDFINLFLYILRIFARSRNND